MNKVIMMGRIVNDLEIKSTPNGVAVCKFRIAVDRNYQKNGEEKATDFFNIVTWKSTAEFVSKWFSKGRLILIEGELQTRKYTDKNSNLATWYEINANNVYFTGEKSTENGANTSAAYHTSQTQTAQYEVNNAQSQQTQSTQNPYASASDDYPF